MSAERRRSAPASGSRSLKPKVALAAPATLDELLAAPVGQSGIPQVAGLRRVARKMGVDTVRDLLFHLPRRYDDLRELLTLAAVRHLDDGSVASTQASVIDIAVQQTWRRRVQVTTARLTDGTGFASATWFGRRYIEKRVRPGDLLLVSGKIRHRNGDLIFEGPEFQPADAANLLHVGRIVPVYRLTAGLTANRLRGAMRVALDRAGHDYPEYLPAAIRAAEDVPPIGEALEAAHYPTTFEARDAALRRLALDELLALQLGMVARRRARGRARTLAIPADGATDGRIRGALEASLSRKLGESVTLTDDQGTAIDEVAADLARPVPMLRLIQGDVGSGKTAVAAWALAAAALGGRQAAMLAPTDLLARQHHATLTSLLEDLGLPITLLTGSLSGDGRRNATEAIASGQAAIVVGTHALLQEKVSFADLGLAVVDEQHRFGVEQRGALEAKATRGAPHVLLMTATPIPRTLGQVLYADLDVSTLRTPPAGRVPIRTGIRRPDDLDGTWDRVRTEAAEGRRTFVVVPQDRGGDGERDRRRRRRRRGRPVARRRPARRGRRDRVGRRGRGRVRAPDRAARAASRRPRPRAPQADRPRRRDGALPRRRPRRARGDDGRRGGRRRPGGDDDGRRGRGTVRARPAPPAPRPGRAGDRRLVLRAGQHRRRGHDRARAPQGGCGHDRRLRARRARLRAPA